MIPTAVRRAFAVTGLLALAACTFDHGDLERLADQTQRDFHRDPTAKPTQVALRRLVENPTAYLFVSVEFTAIFNRAGENHFVPFWTTLLPENYLGFSAWGTEADLTVSDQRARSHPLLFMDKHNPSINDVATASRFSMVRIQGHIVGDFDGKAWFKATRFEVLFPGVYTDSALTDLALGREAMAAKKNAEAIRHFENALDGIWFADVRFEILMSLGGLQESAGNLEAALGHFRQAFRIIPEDPATTAGILRVKQAIQARANASS
jgi:tetratricopeptide (TPR) repeat protein